jgi:hypothetical protein
MMRGIYSRACSVYSWLGTASASTAPAFELLATYETACRALTHINLLTFMSDSSAIEKMTENVERKLKDEGVEVLDWAALAEIFDRPYWWFVLAIWYYSNSADRTQSTLVSSLPGHCPSHGGLILRTT